MMICLPSVMKRMIMNRDISDKTQPISKNIKIMN